MLGFHIKQIMTTNSLLEKLKDFNHIKIILKIKDIVLPNNFVVNDYRISVINTNQHTMIQNLKIRFIAISFKEP